MHVSQHQPSVGAAPEQDGAAGRSLYVPVRRGPAGDVVRLWRTPFGTRTAVAFTSDRRLRSVLGPTQPWIRLSESALRRLAEPLGARLLTIDPLLTARPAGARAAEAPAAAPDEAPAAGAVTEAAAGPQPAAAPVTAPVAHRPPRRAPSATA
jgi:hypothetical protein